MSTLPVDNPGIASVPVSSVGDVARLINSGKEQAKYARMIVFLALGGVFLDAYDLTTLPTVLMTLYVNFSSHRC